MTRVAVVGHLEWVEFVRVERYPERGGLEQGDRLLEQAAGGAVVAASVLAELGAEVDFFCAPGDDDRGRRAMEQLQARGVTVHPAWRDSPTRYVFTVLDGGGERTIVTVGERLAPRGSDALAWERLAGVDGVYVTAGDAGAIREARAAPVVTASPRAREPVPGVTLDALILSSDDEHERRMAQRWDGQTRFMVVTEGEAGGHWSGEASGSWSAAPLPGPARDSYGAGDSFAAGVTFGLASGMGIVGACEQGAHVAAGVLTRLGAP